VFLCFLLLSANNCSSSRGCLGWKKTIHLSLLWVSTKKVKVTFAVQPRKNLKVSISKQQILWVTDWEQVVCLTYWPSGGPSELVLVVMCLCSRLLI